jgi:tRNA (Thr-GGU) A37 N-methylase
VIEPTVRDGLQDLRLGEQVIVLTWLDRAQRDVLKVHPRGDTSISEHAVFCTRSSGSSQPDRAPPRRDPGNRWAKVQVRNLEAPDGTPILYVKPRLEDVRDT